MIRQSTKDDFKAILEIINDAAFAYKGVIPEDRFHEPYMSAEELTGQINDGVEFYCYECSGKVDGIMGIQHKVNVDLIRHAYVRTMERNKGIGGILLEYLKKMSEVPLLIGTWEAAFWAVRFYEKHGFHLVTQAQKDKLLKQYWKIPERQVETSVVLAGPTFKTKLN